MDALPWLALDADDAAVKSSGEATCAACAAAALIAAISDGDSAAKLVFALRRRGVCVCDVGNERVTMKAATGVA